MSPGTAGEFSENDYETVSMSSVHVCVWGVLLSSLPVIERMHKLNLYKQCVYKEKKGKQAGEMEQVKADTSDIHNILY